MQKLTVIGTGAWGTALAIQFAKRGHAVALWGRDKRLVEKVAADRCNETYLPGVTLPDNITLHHDLAKAADSDYLLFATPTVSIRELAKKLALMITARHRGIAWASKGIEADSGYFLHQVIAQEIKNSLPLAIISGPSFASEVAVGLPTALTVASEQLSFAEEIAGLLHGDKLRVYTTHDMIGVECGGALKNIIAIAAGIAEGLQLGENAKAALITRGLNEMIRFSEAMGGKRETIMGLAGIGDIVLSCSSNQSRNRCFGMMIVQHQSAEVALTKVKGVVEGVPTTKIVMRIAQQHNIEMPICSQIAAVLEDKVSPLKAVEQLLKRRKAVAETT